MRKERVNHLSFFVLRQAFNCFSLLNYKDKPLLYIVFKGMAGLKYIKKLRKNINCIQKLKNFKLFFIGFHEKSKCKIAVVRIKRDKIFI